MIKLTKQTEQDFLNREWVQKLLDAGVNMNDAKYCIIKVNGDDTVDMKENWKDDDVVIPTYSTAELLYKIHEWIFTDINGESYSGGFYMMKEAPFYPVYFHLKNNADESKWNEDIHCNAEYPIVSLASVLLQCCKRGIGYVTDISVK